MTRNALWTARLGLQRLDERCVPSALAWRPRLGEPTKELVKIDSAIRLTKAAVVQEPLANCTAIDGVLTEEAYVTDFTSHEPRVTFPPVRHIQAPAALPTAEAML
jgi:hypothetical protein